MTFQRETTYEQALELERRGFYSVTGLRARSEDGVIQYVTRQELEDFLMERHSVTLYTGAPGEMRPFLELDTHFIGGELISCAQYDPIPIDKVPLAPPIAFPKVPPTPMSV